MKPKRKPGKKRFQKPKDDFENKIIDIRRVARVVAGGRRFSFRVSVVVGDKKGKVGVGLGKASDTTAAIEKAIRNAKKKLVKIKMTKENSIPHEVEAKYTSAKVLVRPAAKGSGLVAGSSVRTVLDLAGLKDINAKIISRSKNKMNNAHATLDALNKIRIIKTK